jgi:hypothetical protein
VISYALWYGSWKLSTLWLTATTKTSAYVFNVERLTRSRGFRLARTYSWVQRHGDDVFPYLPTRFARRAYDWKYGGDT